MNTEQTFTNLIKRCCSMREWNLRRYVKKTLVERGFRIIEDDYKSARGGKFEQVHNMLAIRGEPSVCMAAHTDVCRDHGWRLEIQNVDPVVKYIETYNGKRKIIQDRECNVQTGGDDRLGVAIAMWIATHSEKDMAIVLFTDEEIGCVSSDYCSFNELLDFELIAQIDRGNRSNQLVVNIGGTQLCDEETGNMLIQLSKDIGFPREKVNGLLTDVLLLKRNGLAKQAVNMTCGYHNSIGSDPTEYIDIAEAEECRVYVEAIINHYAAMKLMNVENAA